MNGQKPVADAVGLRRVVGWVSRSFGAMLSDLESVDCGSLEVLLYCADDLAISGGGDREAERSLR